MIQRFKHPHTILTLLLLFTFFSRFINLFWGQPYFFHPDERNIASSISQLSFPENFHPHFFAYGSLPIYATFFLGIVSVGIATFDFIPRISFEQAIFILRSFSAIFSTIIVFLLFIIGKRMKNEITGLFASFMGATSLGLIQYAHFGTFEMWLTLGSLLLFLFSSQYLISPTKKTLIGIILSFSLLLSTKPSSVLFIPLVILILLYPYLKKRITFVSLLLSFLITGVVSVTLYVVTNPFVFLDFSAFFDSMKYESGVATGSLPVFYTGEFYNALPVMFPFFHIYPFFLNPIIFLLFFPSLILFILNIINQRKKEYLLIFCFFLILFFSQTFLFAQWSRYFVPTLPFIFLIIAFSLSDLSTMLQKRTPFLKKIAPYFITVLVIISFLYGLAFIKVVYLSQDTRVAAKIWAERISPTSRVLSEVYDLGVLPFNERFSSLTLYNFYELDNVSQEYNSDTLMQAIDNHDYILLPSQRLLKSRIINGDIFPRGNAFYSSLLNNTTGLIKIYETPCDIWCKLIYWGDPIFSFEQTINIFDRPTILIYEKKI